MGLGRSLVEHQWEDEAVNLEGSAARRHRQLNRRRTSWGSCAKCFELLLKLVDDGDAGGVVGGEVELREVIEGLITWQMRG